MTMILDAGMRYALDSWYPIEDARFGKMSECTPGLIFAAGDLVQYLHNTKESPINVDKYKHLLCNYWYYLCLCVFAYDETVLVDRSHVTEDHNRLSYVELSMRLAYISSCIALGEHHLLEDAVSTLMALLPYGVHLEHLNEKLRMNNGKE